MYGTVTPRSVVVCAICAAGGGAAGLYGWNVCVPVSMYEYVKVGVVSHWASVGAPQPATVLHSHGCTCAPAKIGPPLG